MTFQIEQNNLYWLAGILEGEGSFMKPYSKKNTAAPRIAMVSTDKDIIYRVGKLLEIKTIQERKSPPGYGYKTQYFFTLVSSRCIEIMNTLYPLMGERRQRQIKTALDAVPKFWEHNCKWCDSRIKRDPSAIGQVPNYCSDTCRRASRNNYDKEYRNRPGHREYMREYKKKRKNERKVLDIDIFPSLSLVKRN
jgi:hypothetical protein